jgi:hypothetical protein
MEYLKNLEPFEDCDSPERVFRLLNLERAIDEELTAFGYITRPIWIESGRGEIDESCLFRVMVREVHDYREVYSRIFRYGEISRETIDKIVLGVMFL